LKPEITQPQFQHRWPSWFSVSSVIWVPTYPPSIQDRMKDKIQDLLITMPKISLEYMKSLREVAKSLTGFTQLSKATILPKLKLFLGTAGPIGDSVEYLVGLGFTEPTAKFLYNKDKCKGLFACMLIVLSYLFIYLL
jgi:hypothetical protein